MRATVTQLAAYVGKSERTVHRYLASGKWPHKVLPGGLIEIDDSLIEPESEQGAILAALARIEEKLDRLAANAGMMAAKESRPRVHVHTEQAEYTPRPSPGPAQSTVPEGLTPWRDYAREKGLSETTVQRYIDAGQIPVITGRWKRGGAVIKAAIDEEGRAAIDRLFGG